MDKSEILRQMIYNKRKQRLEENLRNLGLIQCPKCSIWIIPDQDYKTCDTCSNITRRKEEIRDKVVEYRYG